MSEKQEKKARKDGADANDLRAVLAAVGAPKDETQWKRLLKYKETEAFRAALALIGDWRGLFKVTTEVARMYRFVQGRFRAVCDEAQLVCATDEWIQQANKDPQTLLRGLAALPGVDRDREYTREELLELLFSHDAVPLQPCRTPKLKVANCYWRLASERRAFPLGDAKCKALLGPVLVTLSTHKAAASLEQELQDLGRARTRLLTLLAGMDAEQTTKSSSKKDKPSKKDKHSKKDKRDKKKRDKKSTASSESEASAHEEVTQPMPSKKRTLVAVDAPPKQQQQFDALVKEMAPPAPKQAKLTTVEPPPKALAPPPLTTAAGVAAALSKVERYRALKPWFDNVIEARNTSPVYS